MMILKNTKKNTNKKIIFADVSLIFIALIRGSSFVAVKDILQNITPFYVIAIRFGFASILLSLIFYKKLKKINKYDIKAGFIIGAFLFSAFAAQTIGLQYTTAGKQAFLTTLYVIVIPFLVWIKNKDKLDTWSILAAVLALIGIGFLTINNDLKMSLNLGDWLTLLCAILFACHIVAISYFSKSMDSIILTILQMGFAGFIAFICALIFEPKFTGINNITLIPIIYLIFVCTMINFLIQNIAQKYTHPNHVGILLCLESVFGAILSIIFLKDIFSLNMVIGCVIIFISIIISETKLSFLKPYISKKSIQ